MTATLSLFDLPSAPARKPARPKRPADVRVVGEASPIGDNCFHGPGHGPGRGVRAVTTLAVLVVALVAAVVSYEHLRALAVLTGEGWRAWLIPLSVDGLILAGSMTAVSNRRPRSGCGPRSRIAPSSISSSRNGERSASTGLSAASHSTFAAFSIAAIARAVSLLSCACMRIAASTMPRALGESVR